SDLISDNGDYGSDDEHKGEKVKSTPSFQAPLHPPRSPIASLFLSSVMIDPIQRLTKRSKIKALG
ncbi:hypothetical protein U1Q18_003551, partial [Sarracenia purpurea var. burkii]